MSPATALPAPAPRARLGVHAAAADVVLELEVDQSVRGPQVVRVVRMSAEVLLLWGVGGKIRQDSGRFGHEARDPAPRPAAPRRAWDAHGQLTGAVSNPADVANPEAACRPGVSAGQPEGREHRFRF